MTINFKIKEPEKIDGVVEVFLKMEDGYVNICACSSDSKTIVIASLNPSGDMTVWRNVDSDLGFNLDKHGRIEIDYDDQ